MKIYNFLNVVACVAIIGGCASTVPNELTNARTAYYRASTGPAASVAPAEVHVAHQALLQAEQSFLDNPDSYQTRDLAYVAQRKAQMAEATASITNEQKKQAQADNNYQSAQGEIIADTKQDLNQSNDALAASKSSKKVTEDKLAAEELARKAAEKRAADALAALAKLAMVKDEPRGMVITLSGSVLFASNQTALLPEAQARLNQVSDVLLTTHERNITVEGHTDSQGSDSFNQTLSQGRADAVRNFIVQRGYQGDLIQAHGKGEGQPIANNANAEGRANNRRVEIIIARDPANAGQYSSNQ